MREPIRICTGCGGLDMVLDASGEPIIAFVSAGRVHVASGAQRFEDPVEVCEGLEAQETPALLADPLMGVAVAFSAIAEGGDREIFVAANPFGPFDPPVNASRMAGEDRVPILAQAPDGRPAIAWAHAAAEAWQVLLATSADAQSVLVGRGQNPCLAVDGTGRYHLCYAYGGDVYYARGKPFSFLERNITGTADEFETEARIGVSTAGVPYVAFLRDGEVWLTGENFMGGQRLNDGLGRADGLSLAMTPSSVPAIAFSSLGDVYAHIAPYGMPPAPVLLSDGWGGVGRPRFRLGPGGKTHVAFESGGGCWYSNDADPPRAAFGATPARGEKPLRVAFSQESTGDVTRWVWDFGDGGKSTQAAPAHVYDRPGYYTVSLTVVGIAGERDTRVEVDAIEVLGQEDFLWVEDIAVFSLQEGVEVSVFGSSPEAIQGFQLGVWFDPAVVRLRELRLSAPVENLEPEFFAPTIFDAQGALTAGVVFDTSPPFDGRRLTMGVRQRLGGILFDMVGTAEPGDVTWIRPQDGVGTPPIKNAFIVDGQEIHLDLSGGRIDVVPFWPPMLRLFRRGDINDDGSMEISDPIYLLSWIFADGPAPPCLDAADLDDGGRIDIGDAINCLEFLFVGDWFPAFPHFSAGLDPTPDDLGECQ
ncbi:MAG: PKD domain-containing protein [Planctomycetes bacterium]|nr:PKD domain-containing protein [Planctomycetota bacterium]